MYFVGIIGIESQVLCNMSLYITVKTQLVVGVIDAVTAFLEGNKTVVILIAVGVLVCLTE